MAEEAAVMSRLAVGGPVGNLIDGLRVGSSVLPKSCEGQFGSHRSVVGSSSSRTTEDGRVDRTGGRGVAAVASGPVNTMRRVR